MQPRRPPRRQQRAAAQDDAVIIVDREYALQMLRAATMEANAWRRVLGLPPLVVERVDVAEVDTAP